MNRQSKNFFERCDCPPVLRAAGAGRSGALGIESGDAPQDARLPDAQATVFALTIALRIMAVR
jgi:hypothetical protein